MITKGIVEEIITPYKIRVRIPFYNKFESSHNSTPADELYVATVCGLPNTEMNYSKGDIVFVGFEDHITSQPIILGQLNLETHTPYSANINVDTITTNIDAYLPYSTTIGEVTGDEIAYLKGVNKNLQFQLDILSQRIAKLEELQNISQKEK